MRGSRLGATLLLILTAGGIPTLAGVEPELANRLATAGENELIPIAVVMGSQVSQLTLQSIPAGDRTERRREARSVLQASAQSSQAALLSRLNQLQSGGEVGPSIRSMWLHSIVLTEAIPGAVQEIAARSDVEIVLLDETIPAEGIHIAGTQGGGSGPSDPTYACGVEEMRAPDIWRDLGYTGAGIVVGVLDTGICIEHPDLASHVWSNPGEIPDNGIDDDGNGYVDDVHGWHFTAEDNDLSAVNFHGTSVAALILGDGTAGLHTGMAPGAEFMVLKVTVDGFKESDMWRGIEYAVEMDADVLNGSVGLLRGYATRWLWRRVVEQAMNAGLVQVFSAGNLGNFFPPFDNVVTPGDVPSMITAGATHCPDLDIWDESSRGPVTWEDEHPYRDWPYPPGKMKPTVSAPGANDLMSARCQAGGPYGQFGGTSGAAAFISGTVAMMLEATPTLSHFQVKEILIETAIDKGPPGRDNEYGAGLMDPYAAVELARVTMGVPATGGTAVLLLVVLLGLASALALRRRPS